MLSYFFVVRLFFLLVPRRSTLFFVFVGRFFRLIPLASRPFSTFFVKLVFLVERLLSSR